MASHHSTLGCAPKGRVARLLWSVLLGAALSCRDPQAPHEVSTVTIVAPAPATTVGTGLQLTAVVRDAVGRLLTGQPTTWASSDTSLGTVSTTGVATGVRPGVPTITAEVAGKTAFAALPVVQLRGRVLNVSGEPIIGAPVSALAPNQDTVFATSMTSDSGRFGFSGLPLGAYRVRLAVPSGFGVAPGQSNPATTVLATSAEVVFTLHPKAADSALASSSDTVRVTLGSGSSVVVPPGVLPAGSTINFRALDSAMQSGVGQALGGDVVLALGRPTGVSPVASASFVAPPPPWPFVIVRTVLPNVDLPVATGVTLYARLRSASSRSDSAASYYVPFDEVTPAVDVSGRPVAVAKLYLPVVPAGYEVAISPLRVLTSCSPSSSAFYERSSRPPRSSAVDPDRVPLVFIHGWQPGRLSCENFTAYWPDDPGEVWRVLLDSLGSDSLVNRRYQFWLARYPTTQPVAASSQFLRQALDTHFGNREVVLLAHSMGGLVAAKSILDATSARVRELLALGVPFSGTPLASRDYSDFFQNVAYATCLTGYGLAAEPFARGLALESEGTRDLAPGSPPVVQVEQGAAILAPVTTTLSGNLGGVLGSLSSGLWYLDCVLRALGAAPSDGVVPVASSVLLGARRNSFSGVDHLEIPRDPDVIDSIRNRLAVLAHQIVTRPSRAVADSGNWQNGVFGGALAESIVVRVTDAFGNGVPRVAVSFVPSLGSGAVSPAGGSTDSSGRARTEWTLGGALGLHTVTAIATGLSPVTFTALAGARVDTLFAVADASVLLGTPSTNYGSCTSSAVCRDVIAGVSAGIWTAGPSSDQLRGYLAFDVSSIPSAATIEAASLHLSMDARVSGPATATIEVRAPDSSWTETGITWSNQPALGGLVASYNIASCIACTLDVRTVVAAWVGGATNHGLMIRSDQELSNPDHTVGYFSREGAPSPGRRPRLVVTWRF